MKTRFFFLSTFWLTLFFCIGAFAQTLNVNLAVDPNSVAPGDDFTLTATIHSGTAQAQDTINEVVFYQSTDSAIDATDTPLGSVNVNAIAAGSTGTARFLWSAESTPGTYYYGASVKAGTSTPEYSTGVPLTVTNLQPNLTVTLGRDYYYDPFNPFGYNSVAPGGRFTLNATVRNGGDGASAQTSSLRIEYRAATSSSWTQVTPISIQPPAVPTLDPNTSSVHTVTLSAPTTPVLSAPLTSGTYQYRVSVAPVSNESNRADNNSNIVIITTSSANLTVDTPTVSKSTLAPGESFTLTAVVRNNGFGPSSSNATLQYYRSTDSTIDATDTPIGTAVSIGRILSGRNTSYTGFVDTSTHTVDLTAESTPNTYYYGAYVSDISNEPNHNTGDNYSSAVTITVSAPPDLVANLFERRGGITLAPRELFTLDATVTNEGVGTSATTTLRFYESIDRRFIREDEVGRVSLSAIASNISSSESIRLVAPSEPGTYYYRVHVNPVANEVVTHNNWSDYIVVFVEAPLVMESLRPSKFTLSAGERFTLTATVKNDGNTASTRTAVEFYRSDDNTLNSRDTSIGTETVSAIAAGRTSQVSHTLTAPNTAGDYYYGACVGDNISSDACAVIKITVVAVLLSEFQRPPMYWVNAGALERLVGANISGLVSNVENARHIAVDVANGKIYWTEQTGNRSGRIRRANLNGANIELVKNLTSVPRGLTIDTVNKKLYLTNSWGKVQRMNLNGSGFQPDLVVNLTSPSGVAVDPAGGKVYWIEQTGDRSGRLQRANLDGTDVELVKQLTSDPHGLTVDTVNRKLYLTNGWGKVQRMNLNGSRFEPNLIVNLDAPRGVAVDTVAKKVYWTEKNKVRRANLDGSNRQDVATGLGSPVGIVLGIAQVQTRVAAAPAAAAAIPNTTALHPNYPNPFNPETWIPYQLATAADVTVTIYDLRGVRIRQLVLGHQPAGVYQSRSRAAYWDGRNSLGEPVASGLYFYTLTAGDFTATRKLLIRK